MVGSAFKEISRWVSIRDEMCTHETVPDRGGTKGNRYYRESEWGRKRERVWRWARNGGSIKDRNEKMTEIGPI